ncbi:type II toxin-antitoxin system VapC family toxin [Halomonas sp. ML-15]|uniref:type II toxin-antitoxin system VapC family toxin n=1 Tax=Halomonas sp. ML-15 TaxID=2773305 RepID=UPI0017463F18|nr:type II toxin-antitoxin system VapC family toxin [Halomonas sp. ML-15]MBD3896777.1 type II toxin-antitoxin system VapC family toxin [Halomonas sp. ML-15]
MSVLVDTSVWVDHFRHRNDTLVELLESDQVMSHPMVVVELACGTPPAPRAQTLNAIELLRPCQQASLREVREFIEHNALYGLGCGLVDMALLASVLITPEGQLWTLDKRLAEMARRFEVAYPPPRYI